MTLAELLTIIIAFAGLALGVRSYFRDKRRDEETATVDANRSEFEQRMTEEAVTIQRQLAEIEVQRHSWELEARQDAATLAEELVERARSADFAVRFAYRDSRHTWARILASNTGQATARDVRLELLAENSDGDPVDVDPVGGTDYRTADLLQPGESVHVGIAFTFGSPQPEDLRYRISWTDDRGPHQKSAQVPL
jgi:hypothetical protein